MKFLDQIYKFFVVSYYLLKQYFNILLSPSEAKVFFTKIYTQAIHGQDTTSFKGKSVKRKNLLDIFPEISKVNINLYAEYGSLISGLYSREAAYLLSPKELFSLAAMVKYLNPSHIFEFGTYKGWSISNMLYNASPSTQVFTLDIQLQEPDDLIIKDILSNENFHRLIGDSKTFNFEPYLGKIDFIFIDADHSLLGIKSDTENALRMLSPQGVIIWHDFNPEHYDVYQYLHELAEKLPLFSIKNTALVIYSKLDITEQKLGLKNSK